MARAYRMGLFRRLMNGLMGPFVRAAGTAEIRRGRRRETLAFEEVDAATAGPVLHAYLRVTLTAARFFDAKAGDPVERFIAEAPAHPVFHITRIEGVG